MTQLTRPLSHAAEVLLVQCVYALKARLSHMPASVDAIHTLRSSSHLLPYALQPERSGHDSGYRDRTFGLLF